MVEAFPIFPLDYRQCCFQILHQKSDKKNSAEIGLVWHKEETNKRFLDIIGTCRTLGSESL